jgi:hypothetical protein
MLFYSAGYGFYSLLGVNSTSGYSLVRDKRVIVNPVSVSSDERALSFDHRKYGAPIL